MPNNPNLQPSSLSEVSTSHAAANTTASEQNLLQQHKKRLNKRRSVPKVKIENEQGETFKIDADYEGNKVFGNMAILETLATASPSFANRAIIEMMETCCRGNSAKGFDQDDVNSALAAIHAIAPQDEIETMIALQMVATHTAAMRLMRQLQGSDTLLQQNSNANLAAKFLRTFTAQMETLNRHRGKGQQKVTVEHVHVHEGGQAIVGNVAHAPRGGAYTKMED